MNKNELSLVSKTNLYSRIWRRWRRPRGRRCDVLHQQSKSNQPSASRMDDSWLGTRDHWWVSIFFNLQNISFYNILLLQYKDHSKMTSLYQPFTLTCAPIVLQKKITFQTRNYDFLLKNELTAPIFCLVHKTHLSFYKNAIKWNTILFSSQFFFHFNP